jgi:phosphomannomutase
VKGLTECGAEVIQIGIGPTPLLYFAVCSDNLDGGVMITGSHNPPSHNGFKFMLGRKSFYGEDIKKLGEIAVKGAYISGNGNITEKNFSRDYIHTLVQSYSGKRPLKVAWDSGNGATGAIVNALIKQLPGNHIPLFTDIDGTFPNHHPDPSVPQNLSDLIKTVQTQQCDVGIAFDGDGDRIGVVDETGEMLFGDQLLAIFASEVLAAHKGAKVIADVKASQVLFDEIAKLGGIPVMWKTGHSLIKTKMAEIGSVLAGEMSGHMFFADKYFGYDDGIYAAIRLLALLANGTFPLSERRKRLPKTYNTPELRIECSETRKFLVIDEVKDRLRQSGIAFSDVDGVRVMDKEGWWLLRASNTQAAIVARCESDSMEGLKKMRENLCLELLKSGINFSKNP